MRLGTNQGIFRSQVSPHLSPLSPRRSIRSVLDGSIYTSDYELARNDDQDICGLTQCIHVFEGHQDSVLAITVTKKYFFTGSQDNTIRVWDLTYYQCKRTLAGHTRSILALAVNNDESFLFSCSNDNSVRVWDINSFTCMKVLLLDAGSLLSLAVTDQWLIAGCQNNQVRCIPMNKVLSSSDEVEMFSTHLTGHFGYIYALLVVPGYLLSASGDATVRVWTSGELRLRQVLEGHQGAVTALVSPLSCNSTECVVFSGSEDSTIRVWVEEGTFMCKTVLQALDGAGVVSLATTSEFLVSAAEDGIIRVWDLETFHCIQTIDRGDLGRVLSLVTSKEMVFCASKTNVEIWGVSTPLYQKEGGFHRSGSATDLMCKVVDTRLVRPVARRQESLLTDRDIVSMLRDFVAIKSVSTDERMLQECWSAAKYLKRALLGLGASCKMVSGREGMAPVVIARMGMSRAKPTVAFYGHYDVVSPGSLEFWDTDPFTLIGKNGYLYGRGSTDNKGPIAAMIFAVSELLKECRGIAHLPCNVVFIFEGEEEIGSESLGGVIKENMSTILPVDVVIAANTYWLDNTQPCLTYGMRGAVFLSVEVDGSARDLHAGVNGGPTFEPFTDLLALLDTLVDTESGRCKVDGFYDDVRSPSEEELKLLDDVIEQHPDFMHTYCQRLGVSSLRVDDSRELLLRLWTQPSLSFHSVTSSFHDDEAASMSAIPRYVKCQLSVRLVPGQNAPDIVQLLSSHLRRQFEMTGSCNKLIVKLVGSKPWWLGNPKNDFFRAAEAAILSEWGCKPLYVREGGTLPVLPMLEKSLRAPAMQIPLGQAEDSAHLPNERIRYENLLRGKEVLRKLLMILPDHVKARSSDR
eukprot:Rmarinus@m.7263